MNLNTSNTIGKRQPNCPCIPQETVITDVQLAAAYVPFQKFCGILSPCEALIKGTAFPELYSPYKKREYVNLEKEICRVPCEDGGRYRNE